jgi:hypothetical protein
MIIGYSIRDKKGWLKAFSFSVAAIVWHRACVTFLVEDNGGVDGTSNPSNDQLGCEEGEK